MSTTGTRSNSLKLVGVLIMLTSLSKVIRGLLPKTDKTVIMDRFDLIFDNVTDNTVKMLSIPDTLGKDSLLYKRLDMRFKLRSDPVTGYDGNVIKIVRKAMHQLADKRAVYRDMFDGSYKKHLFKDAMSYREIQLLTWLVAVDEASLYARRLCLVLHKQELGLELNPTDREYLEFVLNEQNINAFAIIIKVLLHKPEELRTAMDGLKNLSYSEDQEELIRRMKGKKSDPLQIGLIPIVGDIALFVLKLKNSITHARYLQAKEDLKMLQQQILYLERRKQGADEEELENIQKQINYHSGRIMKLQAEIEAIEEKAKGYDYA